MRAGLMLRLVKSAFRVVAIHNCICNSSGSLQIAVVWLEVPFNSNDPFPELQSVKIYYKYLS